MTFKPKDPRCRGCPLETIGQGFARTVGTSVHGVSIFAEALGEDEAKAGIPLVGRAGSTFNRMLTRTKDPLTGLLLRREDFQLGNILNCRPPNNWLVGAPWEHGAIIHCTREYLGETLSAAKPKVIFAMGNVALRQFTGQWGIDKLRGYVLEGQGGIPVVGSYHPSYVQKGKWHLARVWQLDLLKALSLARGETFVRPKQYETHPTLADGEAFLARFLAAGCPILATDIETLHPKGAEEEKDEEWVPEYSVKEDDPSYIITEISFSFEPFTAIRFPWTGAFIPLALRILAAAKRLTGWNVRKFDVPRLEAAGAKITARVYDGMDLWHFLEPSLRAALAYVATFICPDMEPWKLARRETPEYYSCADSDVALRIFLHLWERCAREGRQASFERHVIDVLEVLWKATRRGIAVDVPARIKYRTEFEGRKVEILDGLQSLVPREVKPFKVFKKTEEQLRKQKPGKGGEAWIEGKMFLVEEELTEKEETRLRLKEEKSREKAAQKEAKRLLKLEKLAEKSRLRALAANGQSSRGRKKDQAKKNSPEQPSVKPPGRRPRASVVEKTPSSSS